jgi:hypothetical protein
MSLRWCILLVLITGYIRQDVFNLSLTRTHQQMHTVYIKAHITHTHEPSYMFRRQIAILRETLFRKHVKRRHSIILGLKLRYKMYVYV